MARKSSADSVKLIDTPVGRIGICWRDEILTRVKLPEATDQETLSALGFNTWTRGHQARSLIADEVAERLFRHLSGNLQRFDDIQVDYGDVGQFRKRVFAYSRRIPAGTTITYGELAQMIGSPHAFRAVGQALGTNPLAIVVPCHRVIAANRKLGGFSAANGPAIKRLLLAIEGVACDR